MSRIIAGLAGSIRLKAAAKATRPTSDRVKESLFAKLESMGVIEGARVLDLYSGTGALGLEAVSRGASQVVLVESDPAALSVIEQNIALVLKAIGEAVTIDVFPVTVKRYLQSTQGELDLVLIDPPYAMSGDEIEGNLVHLRPLMSVNGVVVIESSHREKRAFATSGFQEVARRVLGDTELTFFTLQ